MADNRPVPMPPHIKAELERLRALMIPDAEAYRRREIGSKRMEEEAKKIQPLRPLSAADTDLEYLPAAKGGSIKRFDIGGSSISIDDLSRERAPTIPEQFNKYIAPHINRGMDAMFPLRRLIQNKFETNVFDPINNAVMNDPRAALRNVDMNQADVREGKLHMQNAARKAVGMTPLPQPTYDMKKVLGDINTGEFDGQYVDMDKRHAQRLEELKKLIAQPKAKGGVIDMDRMRLELMNKGGLSKQERNANLSKFLENSVVSNPMYHSTVNDFNTFGKTKDIGYHFGSKHVANERLKDVTSSRPKNEEGISGANVMPVHLNIKQPIYVKNDPGFWSPLKFLKEPFWKIDTTVSRKEYNDLSELGKSSHASAEEEEARIKADRNIKRLPSNERTELLSKHHKPFWDEARRLLMRDGFDGLEYANTYEGQGKNKIERRKNPDNTTYVAFHPHQIKSAIGNRGTYDINDPDITKAKGGSVMGVNVASDRKHNLNYADLIVDGHKTIESRNSDTLRPYVGKRVAIVRTGSGKAKAIGEVTIGEPIVANKKQFRNMEPHHLVPEGSTFDIKTPTKHMYPLSEPVRYDEERDVGRGNLSRKVIHKDKGGKIEVRPTVFDDKASRRNPEIEAAARDLLEGKIKQKVYEKTVKKHKPVKPYDFIPAPATDKQAMDVLIDRQKQNWRSHESWPAGHRVGLRLDIPAYERHGVWVNSIHDESGKKEFPTSYGPVSSVRNAEFHGSPHKAVRVATGEQNKTPFAKIMGELEHIDEKQAIAHMKKYLKHPDYRQIGYDPRRHGDFYDRETMEPVTHSEHVVQIGPLVLAKKPKYGKREVYAKGGATHAHHLQIEERPL